MFKLALVAKPSHLENTNDSQHGGISTGKGNKEARLKNLGNHLVLGVNGVHGLCQLMPTRRLNLIPVWKFIAHEKLRLR